MRDHVASFHECQKLSNKKRSFRTRKAHELIKNDMEFTDGPKPTEDDKDAPEPDSPSLIENNVMDFYLYYCDDVFNSFSELNRHKFSKHPPPDLLTYGTSVHLQEDKSCPYISYRGPSQ